MTVTKPKFQFSAAILCSGLEAGAEWKLRAIRARLRRRLTGASAFLIAVLIPDWTAETLICLIWSADCQSKMMRKVWFRFSSLCIITCRRTTLATTLRTDYTSAFTRLSRPWEPQLSREAYSRRGESVSKGHITTGYTKGVIVCLFLFYSYLYRAFWAKVSLKLKGYR